MRARDVRGVLKSSGGRRFTLFALFLAPALHPLLLPLVGPPSHLLWWLHVLPVALLTYEHGRGVGFASVGGSVLLLGVGERLFGFGYGMPADWATVISLGVALGFTHLLIVGFALYARGLGRRYQLLFDRAEIGILRLDPKGNVLAANPGALRLLDQGGDEVEGRNLSDLPVLKDLPPPARLAEPSGWSGMVVCGSGEEEDGTPRHLVAAAVEQAEPPGHQLLLVDRTEEAVQEQELERQSRLASLGEALAGVAHELKNPLSVILAYSEMLKEGPNEDPEEVREMGGDINEQAERMKDLVQELLGYSRPPDPDESVEVEALLERLLRMEEVARGKGIQWIPRIQWTGEVSLPAGRLGQIISNLLANAADALAGSGTIELRSWKEDSRVFVEVADDGPGVPEEMLEGDRIFQPFVTTKGPERGTGLGLAISRRLAEALGGSLTVRNRRSGGAAFTLVLPLQPTDGPLVEASFVAEDGEQLNGAPPASD